MLFGACINSTKETRRNKIEKTYYVTGELKSIKEFQGNNNWHVTEYYKNGNIASMANYYNQKFIGKVRFYYLNGKINFEENYDSSGISQGMFHLWYENGQLKQVGLNEKGKIVGEWRNYYEDGKIERIENYNLNEKSGTWLYFNHKGDTIKREEYKNDHLIK
ncbi:hypothetical protein GCM10023143_25270 [Compostibacter hankyongensis]|uniref:Toxin-antitoxin system YwqK family antitoxin n=2 Tax=Compostibacter hankyongensis TaxID=1007089 RepID=A0ABP8FZV2_9BACT